jgi:hypothetical protein
VSTFNIPTKLDRYGEHLESATIRLSQKGRMTYGHRRGLTTHIVVVPEGKAERQVYQGPLVPGPWAFCVQHATVIDNFGGSGREAAEAPIGIEVGIDTFTVDGLPGVWQLVDRDPNKFEGDGVKLVPADEVQS